MTIFFIASTLFLGSILAGFVGSLSGLGGGVIITPLIVLGLGADIHYAIGTSLIAIIASSTAASCVYITEGYSNIRIGIFLETATTIGALTGVAFGSLLQTTTLELLFAAFLIYAVITSIRHSHIPQIFPPDVIATRLKLNSEYPIKGGYHSYSVRNVLWGYLIMFIAGGLSGLLGVGAGVLKVVALDKVMGLPFKVSTTTSNFMIGVTAAASAGLYVGLGYVDPVLTMPVVLGVPFGSLAGARLLPHIKTKILRRLFAFLIAAAAIQMIVGALR